MIKMEGEVFVYSVSELSAEIKNILNSTFENIWVEGEVSGFKISSLNHCYFDLKDEQSVISCVIFKWNAKNIDFEIKNGLFVRVFGDLTTFEKQSKYQIVIKKVIPVSLGNLYIEFEKLKKKLESEGLFDEKRKKRIPPFPSKVGVVTSLHGAAVKDIISVIKRRAPHISILIYPVKVQGEGAKEDISQAIKDFNIYFKDVDVLLVGRGGGSMEDLWAFNEEMVARAIAFSDIPVISCVGHQTDFTIADFVADLRAPTPSAAAEIVSRNAEDVIVHIKQLEKRLISTLKIIYHRIFSKFSVFINSNVYKNPFSLIESKILMLDNLYSTIMERIEEKLKDIDNRNQNLLMRLKNLDPSIPFKKGFATVKKSGKIIKSVKDVKLSDLIEINLSDGNIETTVKKIEEK